MKLINTEMLMESINYKCRFKAEAGTINFALSCPRHLLCQQVCSMGNYLRCLEVRSEIEGTKRMFGKILRSIKVKHKSKSLLPA